MVDSETDLIANVSTDKDLVTRETVTEDTIMTQIRDVVEAVEDAATDEEDDDDDDDDEPPPTLREALAMLKKTAAFLGMRQQYWFSSFTESGISRVKTGRKMYKKSKANNDLEFS